MLTDDNKINSAKYNIYSTEFYVQIYFKSEW